MGANLKDNVVRSIIIHNKSLLQCIKASIFIDATGDGILSQHAGEKILPTQSDVNDGEVNTFILPSQMVFLAQTQEAQRQEILPNEYLDDIDFSDNITGKKYSEWNEKRRLGIKMKLFDIVFDTGDGKGYSDSVIFHRKHIHSYVNDAQKRYNNYVLDSVPPMLGIREGRRIEGDYILNADDIRSGRKFYDSIGYCSFSLDANGFAEVVPIYQIPYRSIIAKGIENVFVIGRCFSSTRLALSSARVMPSCSMMGQGAGYAGAIAVTKKIPIREVDTVKVRECIMDGAKNILELKKRLC